MYFETVTELQIKPISLTIDRTRMSGQPPKHDRTADKFKAKAANRTGSPAYKYDA